MLTVISCVQKYYGGLKSTGDLQSNSSTCSVSDLTAPKSVREALSLVHPEVTKKYGLELSLLAFA